MATVNTFLPAGTYWVDWQADGTLASGPWAPPVSILGQTTTGNALQFTSTGWAAVTDGPRAAGLPLHRRGVGRLLSSLSDVPWLSVGPINGTVTPAADAGAGDLRLHRPGQPATYTANLCITCNDPDPGPGNGTELVIVPVDVDGHQLRWSGHQPGQDRGHDGGRLRDYQQHHRRAAAPRSTTATR